MTSLLISLCMNSTQWYVKSKFPLLWTSAVFQLRGLAVRGLVWAKAQTNASINFITYGGQASCGI